MKIDLLKADFVAAFAFSAQIDDSQVRPFITAAYDLDLLPLLGHETLERLAVLPDLPTVADYVSQVALAGLTEGALVRRRDRIYKALVASPATDVPTDYEPTAQGTGYPADPAPEGEWLFLRLQTLWAVYLKPYWLQASYVRFLLNHGVNVTKAGLTVPVDRASGTYDRPSPAQVAQMLADARITADAHHSRLSRFLRLNGLLYVHDAATGRGYYGAVSDHCPGDPFPAGAERARYATSRPRPKSRLRGV